MTARDMRPDHGQKFASLELPLVERLPADFTCVQAFQRLAGLPHVLFLDSALRDQKLGRY